jgi:hypothetical protein
VTPHISTKYFIPGAQLCGQEQEVAAVVDFGTCSIQSTGSWPVCHSKPNGTPLYALLRRLLRRPPNSKGNEFVKHRDLGITHDILSLAFLFLLSPSLGAISLHIQSTFMCGCGWRQKGTEMSEGEQKKSQLV